MAQTETELFNLAAQMVGARGALVSTTQASRYTDVFNLWFPYVRAVVLKAAQWPTSSKSATLSLLTKRSDNVAWANTDPTPGAKYAYNVPADFLHPRYLSSYGHFTMGMVGNTRCIFAHEAQAILTYTFDQANTGLWEPELFMTMAQALGAYSAMTLTGKPTRAKLLEQQANEAISKARANSLDMEFAPVAAVSRWHAARGYTGRPTASRYVFPDGPLIAVGESANVK